MNIRETMNKHPGISAGIAGGVLLIAAVAIAMQLFGGSTEIVERRTAYSDDDGKTFFEDSAEKLSPFDHNGKQAYRVQLYTCDGGQSAFVGYLERYTPPALEKMRAAVATRNNAQIDQVFNESFATGMEVKKPGSDKWVARNAVEANEVLRPTCPDGKGELKMWP